MQEVAGTQLDKEQVDAYLANEPYVIEKVWEDVKVEPLNVVILQGEKVGK